MVSLAFLQQVDKLSFIVNDLQILTAEAFDNACIRHQLQFLDGHGMWVIEDDGRVREFQGIAVVVDENLTEAAISMQLKNGNQMFFRELLAQSLYAGVHFGRRMGEVAEDEVIAVVEQQFQTSAAPLKEAIAS